MLFGITSLLSRPSIRVLSKIVQWLDMVSLGTKAILKESYDGTAHRSREPRKERGDCQSCSYAEDHTFNHILYLAGYARNYLHPERLAVYATEPNVIKHSLPYFDHIERIST